MADGYLLTPKQRVGAIKTERRKAELFRRCEHQWAQIAAYEPVAAPAWMCGSLRELFTSGEMGTPRPPSC